MSGARLGHAVSHSDGELDLHEELLCVGADRRSAHYELTDFAAENIEHFFADGSNR